jgi:hypothetical protein
MSRLDQQEGPAGSFQFNEVSKRRIKRSHFGRNMQIVEFDRITESVSGFVIRRPQAHSGTAIEKVPQFIARSNHFVLK